jgi:uncharacterized membrane protein
MDTAKSSDPAAARRNRRPWKRLAGFWHLHLRLVISAAFGTAVAVALLAMPWSAATRILAGWDTGIILYLALIYWLMAHASVDYIRRRACTVDEGAIALLVLSSAASLASLAAVVAEFGYAPSGYTIMLGMGTILLSWAFMHTIFALHYAHEFYGEGRDDRVGGLVFPGDEDPDYWDFMYYSLVVAMTAQVSDVQITSKVIRRLTTTHGVISFFFNVAVLALTVNMVSSLIQPGR